VHAHHAHQGGPRAGQRENRQAAEAKADGGEPAIGLGTRGERRQPGLRPLDQAIRIVAQPGQAGDHALPVAGHAVPEHVAGQDHVTVLGVPPRLALGVVIETGPAVHEQQPGQRLPGRVVPGENAGQGGLIIVIGQLAGRDCHCQSLPLRAAPLRAARSSATRVTPGGGGRR